MEIDDISFVNKYIAPVIFTYILFWFLSGDIYWVFELRNPLTDFLIETLAVKLGGFFAWAAYISLLWNTIILDKEYVTSEEKKQILYSWIITLFGTFLFGDIIWDSPFWDSSGELPIEQNMFLLAFVILIFLFFFFCLFSLLSYIKERFIEHPEHTISIMVWGIALLFFFGLVYLAFLQPDLQCNCSKTCGEIYTCEEAQYQLNTCGCSKRDGDKDGVACDNMCEPLD